MKEPFNDVPTFIEILVIRSRLGATVPGWDHRHPTARDDLLSKRIRVVSFIAYHKLVTIPLDQPRRLRYIVAVSRGQNQPQGNPGIAERKIQFRGKSAPTSSEACSILSAFFFRAPAAQECARTIVESTRIAETSPAS